MTQEEGNLVGLWEGEHEDGFNADIVEPTEDFKPVPAGDYVAMITDSEIRSCSDSAKDPDGELLWLGLEILEGDYKGRKLWDQLNVVNKNAQTVEIAQRDFSAICRACGKRLVRDSTMVHEIPMNISVIVKPAKGDWAAKNEIKKYKSLNPDQIQTTTVTDDVEDEPKMTKKETKPPKKSTSRSSDSPKPPWQR